MAGVAPIDARPRPFPDLDLDLEGSVLGFFDFVTTTAVNKLAGLTDEQAAVAPLSTSPNVSLLGLLKHLTAVLRQHLQIHIGGEDLPLLWSADDTEVDFRLGPGDTVEAVVAAFDEECARSRRTIARTDLDAMVLAYGRPVRAGRLLVDVLQESARHLGHMDLVREWVDGAKGE